MKLDELRARLRETQEPANDAKPAPKAEKPWSFHELPPTHTNCRSSLTVNEVSCASCMRPFRYYVELDGGRVLCDDCLDLGRSTRRCESCGKLFSGDGRLIPLPRKCLECDPP